jgi:transposase
LIFLSKNGSKVDTFEPFLRSYRMHPDALPNDVELLKSLLLKTQQEAQAAALAAQQKFAELSAFIDLQQPPARQHEPLQQQLDQAQLQIDELADTILSQREKLERQEQVIADLLAALRGKQRERFDPNQLLLFDVGELEALLQEDSQPEPPPQPRRRTKKSHGRRLIPDGLPEEVILYELPEADRICDIDGAVMQPIRFEISKQLDYEPPRLKVIVHKRAVYACPHRHDQAVLPIAPKPPQPIEKGLAAPGLLAALTVGKFGDHLPGYRLEDIFSRGDFSIRRSTIFDWLSACADLVEPLVARMKQRLLQSKVIHTDDTSVKLIDHILHGTKTARFWANVGDRGHPYTVYDFTQTRERAGPQEFLVGFSGYLQADAYSGYDGIYLDPSSDIIEVACWAHARRYWWKAREQDPRRASYALSLIGRLYKLEREAKDWDAAARKQLRVEQARPLLTEFKTWLDEQELLPKSRIGQAQTYTLNQWAALQRYLEDGDLSIDNNLAERTVKPIAIGRKNWLFVGSEQAGQRAARLMSLVASCKANHVEPWAYLRDVYTQLPQLQDETGNIDLWALDHLLPDVWLTAHPEHRWNIADTRAAERAQKGNL